MMDKLWKVYGWRNIHTDEWYVGQTTRLMKERCINIHTGSGYRKSTKFYQAIQKYGFNSFEQNILRLCTTQQEADEWERYFISHLNATYNTDSGGILTHTLCEETKRKISEKNKGKILSDEVKVKISKANKNHPKTSRKILQYTTDGQYVDTYPSLREAHRQTGLSLGHISECCNGIQNSLGGYLWRFAQV